MSVNFGSGVTIVSSFWTAFKATVIAKSLPVQYLDDGTTTTVFAFDGPALAYITTMWDGGNVPSGVQASYSISQNNSDLTDFQTNWQAGANKPIGPIASQQVVMSNFTVIVGGSQIFAGFTNREVNLFINVTASPTGTLPGLQFTIQELDPGDLTTVVGTSITGTSITTGPTTQELTLNLTTSNVIKVSWIIVGTGSPTFTGVYATLTTKPSTVISGVDVTGVERVMQPDTAGRIQVVGSTAVGGAATGNPVMMGGANAGGFAGYVALASDNSTIVSQGANTQPILVNGTITSNGLSNVVGLGVPMVNLFINIKNIPTGTNPTVTFTMQEVDPGDKATSIGTSVTGAPLTGIGTQILSLPLTTSGVVAVTWTVSGVSPSFTGVYVTASMKDANVIVGPTARGTVVSGNPIQLGAIDSQNLIQALSARLINGSNNLIVYDELTSNKLDLIILLLTDIRDKKILGE